MLPSKWLLEFKLAIIAKDCLKCTALVQETPKTFTCKEELEEAAALTQEAIALFETEKLKLGNELTKLKRTKKYLASHAN